MTLIQKSVTINASVDKVLSVLEDPERQSELNPNLKILSHTPSPLGYFDTKWEYRMAGIPVQRDQHDGRLRARQKHHLRVQGRH